MGKDVEDKNNRVDRVVVKVNDNQQHKASHHNTKQ